MKKRISSRLTMGTGMLLLGALANAQQTISIQPIKIENASITAPVGYYTWNSYLGLKGAGWKPGEVLEVHLVGPQNSIGVTPADRMIATAFVASDGTFNEGKEFGFITNEFYIPYNQVLVGNTKTTDNKQIPRPGAYSLVVQRPDPQTIYDKEAIPINIAPDTIPPGSISQYSPNGWPWNRGARDGWLGSHSPERGDPEWISLWSEQPVGLYATIAKSSVAATVDDPPANQPSFIAIGDAPMSHYAHDINMELLPDSNYLWTLATANFIAETFPGKVNFGKLECEWEVQNDGRPFYGDYEKGVYGMPLWVMPTAGDRVYMVGRWVMDNGHPDSGDRTEIHPPRLLATMRQRNTAVSGLWKTKTRASQVDIYISGNGGGANMFPDGLAGDLDKDGPGGIISDELDVPDLLTYFSWGPINNDFVSTFISIVNALGWGGTDPSLIKDPAGPSGLDWLRGPQFRPVDDMDYDFDVPLPTPPAGATRPFVNTTFQPGNSANVEEVITYTHPFRGLPTVAHFHIPYKGTGDAGIFAKTFKFYWDVFSKPGEHFTISINNVAMAAGLYNDLFWAGPGPLYLWTDVCGQWASLTDANPGALATVQTSSQAQVYTAPFVDNASANTHAVSFDAYLDYTDTLRVYTLGYAQRDFDNYFGQDVGKPIYSAGYDLAWATYFGTGENQNPGGALYDVPVASKANVPNLVGPHTEASLRSSQNEGSSFTTKWGNPLSNTVYAVNYNVAFVPGPGFFGETGLPLNFGEVCYQASSQQTIQISNTGESNLSLKGVVISGPGFSTVPAIIAPRAIGPGQMIPITIAYSPIGTAPATGSIAFQTDDPVNPVATYGLSGTPGYPVLTPALAPSATETVTVGQSERWHVTITNPGNCPLTVRPSIANSGYSIVLPSSYYDIFGHINKPIVVLPGGTNIDLQIVFRCTSAGAGQNGALTLTSNAPVAGTQQIKFNVTGVN
ncbi:MAG: choice-of-anchor D domain-containing protein [Fimbriimonas sp.]|nr:choice-of-anchor D domain-containing protein [Fimbriimonas sp.]